MSKTTYRKCANCGEISLNQDYCPACGHMININLKRESERIKTASERKQKLETTNKENPVSLFFEKVKNHDNFIIKYVARFFYSIWIIVVIVGSFLALVFSYIAA
ncbi:hypothetical protein [Nonlabens antarcticus]|uniref:hypothetical protein n=1 Tax=Nonlabens antarcticus TaxID=392714 RepID=UPI0018910E9F|nr:hypothetical protein [Nonlabens antarcticus]